MPANITAVVHPAGQESLWVDILEQSATDPAKSRSDRFKKIDVKNQGETPRSESKLGRKTPKGNRQCIPHLQAGAGEPRLHTGFANAERICCFGDTELLHIPQYEHGTI